MSEYEEKCKLCKHNYQPLDCEPRCNCMCANHDYFEPITTYGLIMKMDEEDLAYEFLIWLYNHRDEAYMSDFRRVYDKMVEWLRGNYCGAVMDLEE